MKAYTYAHTSLLQHNQPTRDKILFVFVFVCAISVSFVSVGILTQQWK